MPPILARRQTGPPWSYVATARVDVASEARRGVVDIYAAQCTRRCPHDLPANGCYLAVKERDDQRAAAAIGQCASMGGVRR